LRALHRRGERRSPYDGHPPDAPTIETIVLLTFYGVINRLSYLKRPETPNPDGVSGLFLIVGERGLSENRVMWRATSFAVILQFRGGF